MHHHGTTDYELSALILPSALSAQAYSLAELRGDTEALKARFDALPPSTETDGVDEIVLAGGCFWGTQALFDLLNGVVETTVGYANAHPDAGTVTYETVCSGATGALEAVRVRYRTSIISTSMILRWFFASIHPTQRNRQGNDFGTQYQTAILCLSRAQVETAAQIFEQVQAGINAPVFTQVDSLVSFVPAEGYHQHYLMRHPGGYCHVPTNLIYRAQQWEAVSAAVLEQNATEHPHTGAHCNRTEPGIYVDYLTGAPLFSSTDKFDAGCGWPSFSAPIQAAPISEHLDRSHFMTRTEVRSSSSNTHLGHVFTDGPSERGGLRYCINSAALAFIPRALMKAFGYADLEAYYFAGEHEDDDTCADACNRSLRTGSNLQEHSDE